jgi:hypothetical protein
MCFLNRFQATSHKLQDYKILKRVACSLKHLLYLVFHAARSPIFSKFKIFCDFFKKNLDKVSVIC